MRSNLLIFAVAFLVAFGAGYLFFHDSDKTPATQQTTENNSAESNEETPESEDEASVPSGAEPLTTNSCIGCHAVNDAGITGGTTGPDLSDAYANVKDKHGIELDEFLQQPTSAVMSGVIAENPLSDEDREQIVEFLKKTSEK
ncbi:cytochrome c [Sporosarcina sp.]|uniref:c-type cytochrome n=1 Tax=Sporosarcina sp. TaxID=49982 RepID=UPI002622788F|nr:cytochrome c [Sporosarcina sp.]